MRFGDYHVLDRIAEGGMGLVLRAQDLRSGRRVAIKTVCSGREVDAAAIRREIVTLSNLRHPGIVRLHTYGEEGGVPWMALELLEGRTVGEEISWYWPQTSTGAGERPERTDELPTTPVRCLRDRGIDRARPAFSVAGSGHLRDVFSIVEKVCFALDHVHRAGLVHRDVKPANIFLGDDGRTTLIDFGLACAAATTRENEVGVGTMEYAAPEQICGGPVDRRADVYSLGCVLYELVTGRLPFRGDSAGEIAARQIRREAVAPSVLSAEVPGQLDDLVMSMLAKTPAQRPENVTEVGWRLANIARRLAQRSHIAVEDPAPRLRQAG
jgi:eukaryotic-like serine/threonine-protein kinase